MDTAFYSSFERAVVDLEQAVCRDRSHVVLVTSQGPGRGALTRALEQRLSGSLRPLELPVPTATCDEIRARIIHQLGGDPSSISEREMTVLLREIAAGGSALLLLVRDADAMPVETLSWLGRLAAESSKGLRLVLVVTVEGGSKGDLIPGLIAALGVGAQKVVLETPGAWAEQPVSGSPRSAGSPAAALAHGAHPWRSRIETIREQTVRTRDPRQSSWRGRASIAAAALLLAFGVHHLAVVPVPSDLAASPDSQLAKATQVTKAKRAKRATDAENAENARAQPTAQRHAQVQPGVEASSEAAREEEEKGEGIGPVARPSEWPRAHPATRPRLANSAAPQPPSVVKIETDPAPRAGGLGAAPVALLSGPVPAASRAPGPEPAAEVAGRVTEEVDAIALRPDEQSSPAAAEAASEVPRDAPPPPTMPARDSASALGFPVAAVSLGSGTDSSVELDAREAPDAAENATAADATLDLLPNAGPAAMPLAAPAAPTAARETAEPATGAVVVSINSRPWARIRIDGRDVGITPLANLELSPGPHHFYARLADGRELERTVHVDEYRDRISFP